jgi:hypothetical protein
MVAKPAAAFRLPDAPQPLGRLLEAGFGLWQASWRAAFPYALLYGLAGLLPALTLGALTARLVRAALGVFAQQRAPWLPLGDAGDPAALFEAVWSWLAAPSTWMLLGGSLLLMLAALSLMIHRQAGVVALRPAGHGAALARLPAGLGAWLAYTALMLLAVLPLVLLAWLCFHWALQVDLGGLAILMLVFLVGGLLASVPLAWLSVAAGFAPFASAIDAAGPWRAQRLSVDAVRGHWLHAAVAMTLPWLLYFGLASVVSSLCLLLCGALAFGLGGWAALLAGHWLGWAQWLGLVPVAVALPLATAGGLAAWHDLRLRQAST